MTRAEQLKWIFTYDYKILLNGPTSLKNRQHNSEAAKLVDNIHRTDLMKRRSWCQFCRRAVGQSRFVQSSLVLLLLAFSALAFSWQHNLLQFHFGISYYALCIVCAYVSFLAVLSTRLLCCFEKSNHYLNNRCVYRLTWSLDVQLGMYVVN